MLWFVISFILSLWLCTQYFGDAIPFALMLGSISFLLMFIVFWGTSIGDMIYHLGEDFMLIDSIWSDIRYLNLVPFLLVISFESSFLFVILKLFGVGDWNLK